MKVTVIPGKSLTSEYSLLWSSFQQANSQLSSPYFCPEFTSAVAAVRKDVWVGIIEEAGKVAGFFPFQRGKMQMGYPIGGHLCDYQGLVLKPGIDHLDAAELIRACGLKGWKFDHLIASQLPFHPFHRIKTESSVIDLSQGYNTYLIKQKAQSNWIQKVSRNIPKIEREVGPLRFEAHVPDTSLLRLLMRWKSNHYRRTGASNDFKVEWIVRVVEQIHATKRENFAGMLSVLYMGDEVAALHLGMRSRSVWHYWFPSYNQQFHKYSPGLILLLKMIESAQLLGLQTIDLGQGDESYKLRVRNGTIPLAEGCVEISSLICATVLTTQKLRRSTKKLSRIVSKARSAFARVAK
ncbi:GNAT family N-acetyltransferase [Fischerella sp. PCC 9605]|uniref:GNAT family N-acetyltransferase n=1 Tax=Fischerella sp. PCC 9605 TaxID=1173024 RepID=UPI0004B595EE|nr:GNAT family N-acetyltransferase [Fischerella sp. PCC 9605]